MDELNFSYGIIGVVGVLAAISIGFISMDPNEIIEPRIIAVEEKPVACTMQWDPVCGVDGETYGNQCGLDAVGVKLDYAGECLISEPEVVEEVVEPEPEVVEEVVEPEPEVMEEVVEPEPEVVEEVVEPEPEVVEEVVEPEPEVVEEVVEPKSSSMTAIVSVPPGTAIPGCDETDECYLPFETNVAAGATVSWINDDSAAHTVTSGNINAGVTGVFDSGLFMAGSTFEFTFTDVGTFDYFCQVHPWMTGFVNVN